MKTETPPSADDWFREMYMNPPPAGRQRQPLGVANLNAALEKLKQDRPQGLMMLPPLGMGNRSFFGFHLLESEFLTEWRQVRFPKTKRKRIQRKWTKRTANWGTVPNEGYFLQHDLGVIVAHPKTMQKLRDFLRGRKVTAAEFLEHIGPVNAVRAQ